MSKTVYIWVCGIQTFPGESDNWTGKAVTHCISVQGLHSEKVEYFSGAFWSRSIGQKARAEKLRKTLQRYIYKGWKIVLGGHSNGCDVILDALKDMDWPRIEKLHLISGACEADFEKNGLNNVDIGVVKVYVAGEDKALKLADSFLGRMFGYGCLGKCGPVNAKIPVEIFTRADLGHSDWFSPANFEETMGMLTA